MDDRDFMDMMYQGMTKTTHAEDAYWGFEPTPDRWTGSRDHEYKIDGEGFDLFYVAADNPDAKVVIGHLDSEADAAFITAVHGSFPDIHRKWLEALDEADQKDLEKDMAESVAANLSDRLARAESVLVRYDPDNTEDWHGKATQST